MDYIDFCKKYYATTKIPISLLLGTAGKYSTIGELFSVEPLTDYPVLAGGPNPSIHFYSSEIIYGCICIEETDYVIILGPIFECPVTPSQINLFMQESAVPAAYREQIVEFFIYNTDNQPPASCKTSVITSSDSEPEECRYSGNTGNKLW